mmetsp:Transcript_45492/g.73835  ORF Transcript_45492/g.73835 Transcript_45492/m.73835 type:complete len:333 (+) Transcript_45492:615-1613(+)
MCMLCKEDCEGLGVTTRSHLRITSHHLQEVKLLRLRQARQSKSKDAVEDEVLERILRHLGGRDEPQRDALQVGRVRGSSNDGAVSVRGGSVRSNTGIFETDRVLDEDAIHFPGAKGHAELVAGLSLFDLLTIGVDVLGSEGTAAAIPAVRLACCRAAVGARQDQVPAACVKNDFERLGWVAHVDNSPVGTPMVDLIADRLCHHLRLLKDQREQVLKIILGGSVDDLNILNVEVLCFGIEPWDSKGLLVFDWKMRWWRSSDIRELVLLCLCHSACLKLIRRVGQFAAGRNHRVDVIGTEACIGCVLPGVSVRKSLAHAQQHVRSRGQGWAHGL